MNKTVCFHLTFAVLWLAQNIFYKFLHCWLYNDESEKNFVPNKTIWTILFALKKARLFSIVINYMINNCNRIHRARRGPAPGERHLRPAQAGHRSRIRAGGEQRDVRVQAAAVQPRPTRQQGGQEISPPGVQQACVRT